jgi:hypothetical protein
MLGLFGRKPTDAELNDSGDDREWTRPLDTGRPAHDRGIGYTPERAAEAKRNLDAFGAAQAPELAAAAHSIEASNNRLLQSLAERLISDEAVSVAYRALTTAAVGFDASLERCNTVPWLRAGVNEPGTISEAGVYWHCDSPGDPESLAITHVMKVGDQLCVAYRRAGSDSVVYLNVRAVRGYWAGPLPIPEGVDVRQVNLPLP